MRVAVIGTGAIAPLHIRALLNCKQEIVALCDVDGRKAETVRDRFSLKAAVYTDYMQMLESESLDAVHICTPHYLHARMVCAALDRNINVLCEKPLAISFAQLEEIEKSVKTSEAILGVNMQHRYNRSLLYVKEFFKDKPIISAEAHLVWQRNKEYYAQDAWRGKWSTEGGGVMINQAIHHLDILQHICGMPQTVTASVANYSLRGITEVEDTAFGLFRLPGGGSFIINATNAANYSFPIGVLFRSSEDTVEISGDNIIMNGKFLTKSNGLPVFGKEEWGTGHQNLIADYYNCLAEGRKFDVDFYEGSKAVRLVLKMYSSHGNEISIQE